MTIQEKIDDFVSRTNNLTETNPEISNIAWAIDDVPYVEFNNFRRDYNSTIPNEQDVKYLKENQVGNKMYVLLLSYFLKTKCDIAIYSTPVKVTITHQVEELNK